MEILWVTSEAVPYAKTGGLADVSGALPDALAQRGHNVTVIMPYYPQVTGKLDLHFDGRVGPLGVPMGAAHEEWAIIRTLSVNKNLTFCFVEHNRYFDRPKLYDWNGKEFEDNAERFIFFSRAAMQASLALGLRPDIIHANDWHAALTCVYLKSALYNHFPAFKNTRSVLTIHNIGYQGNFDKNNMYLTGLPWDFYNYNCLEAYDRMNFLKGGVMTADMVNAVSPTYACEILSPEYGFGLDGALRNRVFHGKLRGILNRIDMNEWNHEKDKALPEKFSVHKMKGKKKAKNHSKNNSNCRCATTCRYSPQYHDSLSRRDSTYSQTPSKTCCNTMISNSL